VLYQNPLAYLLGLEGLALLRAYEGRYDRTFTHERFDEIRRLLDAADELGDGVEAREISTAEVYAGWAAHYDEPGNELIDLEQPVVREILAGVPVGRALDVACGTGRHTAYLAERGHTVIGVDTSPEMLAVARQKVPAAEFHVSDLHDLPFANASFDVVVCALSLAHVPDLTRAFAEFVRVLKPGGDLVLSDSRGLIGDLGAPSIRRLSDGTFGYLHTWNRLTSEYLAAALPLGLRVRRCEELFRSRAIISEDGTNDPYDNTPPPPHLPGQPPNYWALNALAPKAAIAAWRGNPIGIVWHFRTATADDSRAP
jgi:ubiquinone/menaquinone biosynthesis C-methylase UbiE